MLFGRVVMPGTEAIFKRLLNESLDKNVQFCRKDRMHSALANGETLFQLGTQEQ